MKAAIRTLAFVMVAVIVSWSNVVADSHVPLPRDTNVMPPGADVSSAAAAFSGRWEGAWNTGLPHVLIIRKISQTKTAGKYEVDAIYAWGGGSGTTRPGFLEADGTIDGGELFIQLRGAAQARYKMGPDKRSIDGVWQARGAQYVGTFRRIDAK